MAKVSLSANYSGSGAYWFPQIALNRMGDPELPIYTTNPRECEGIQVGNRLTVNTGGVEDCRICLTGASTEKGWYMGRIQYPCMQTHPEHIY